MPALDAIVLGGGPAGAACARLLASWGHDVLLMAGEPRRGVAPRALAESLPPSTGKLFDALGVRDAIDHAGFIRSTGNTVWWGVEEPRVETFGEGRLGWQVTTDALAAVLLASAVQAGARVERRSITAGEAMAIGARFRLDCTGRAGVLARPLGVRVDEPHLRTVALVGAWRIRTPEWIPDDTHTLIESYPDGWAWSVPVGEGQASTIDIGKEPPVATVGGQASTIDFVDCRRLSPLRHLAVMVEPGRSNLAEQREARDVYLAEIAKTRHFRALTSGDARLEEGPRGWDASMYHSSRYVDGSTLLTGDAGSFVDPLSSAGVRKALISAWVAAIAVHTALIDPDRRGLALRFFDAREADLYAGLRRLTTEHLAGAARGHDDPFWVERSMLAAPARDPERDVDAVRAAYDDLRRRPVLSLQLATGARIEPRAVIEGCEIVAQPHLMIASDPAPVRFLHDVEIPALVEIATGESDAGAMFDTYCARRGPVPLPQFLTALSTLVARGGLCYKDHTKGPE